MNYRILRYDLNCINFFCIRESYIFSATPESLNPQNISLFRLFTKYFSRLGLSLSFTRKYYNNWYPKFFSKYVLFQLSIVTGVVNK